MKLTDFSYHLPEDLIAQHPLKNRDASRMMVINRADGSITHDYFKNISKHLPEKIQFVFNDSKVIPARLIGVKEKTGGEVEIFLLKQLDDPHFYEVLLRPMKRLRVGMKIIFPDGVHAIIEDKDNRIVRFNREDLGTFLDQHGRMPLPPYIKRQEEQSDRTTYQTVYAKKDGSVAAPTAGLHFTHDTLNHLKKEGHDFHYVTLHVGYGTFQPVEADNILDHDMHYEQYEIEKDTWEKLKSSHNICAVGTTPARVLESVAAFKELSGHTNLFIYPGYSFKMVDHLLTNFHLPNSTLLMLIYAFGGMDLMKKAYAEAIKEKYRFYSYGDCMLIL